MAAGGGASAPRRRGPNSSTPARREQLARAAIESFAEHGFERASLRDIAARAGVTHAAVLRHFGSKDDLLIAALEMRDRDDAELARRMGAANATRGEIIEALFRDEFRDPAAQRHWLLLTIAATDPEHPAHEFFVARRARMRNQFRDTVVAGYPGGVLAAADKVTLAHALFDGVRIQTLLDPQHDALPLVELVLGLVAGPPPGNE